jgi:hypothetical protein
VAATSTASHKPTRKRITTARGVEVDRGRFLRPGGRFERDLGLGAIEDLGADRVGEGADAGVIGLHRLVIIAARNQDRILGPLDLRLQRQEILVGLQVRISFLQPLKRDDRLGQPVLRIVEGADLFGIVEVGGAQGYAAGVGAGLCHLDQHLAFLLGIALHGRDEVGNEVGAALIFALNIGPFGVDVLLGRRDRVEAASGQAEGSKRCQESETTKCSHCSIPL